MTQSTEDKKDSIEAKQTKAPNEKNEDLNLKQQNPKEESHKQQNSQTLSDPNHNKIKKSHSKSNHNSHKNPQTINNFNNILNKAKEYITSSLKNPYTLTFLIILTIALTLRLKYFNMESIWNDAAVHLWYAIKFTNNPLTIFSHEYLLGDYFIFQTITGIVYLFTKNVFLAGKLVALAFSLTGVYLIYKLGTELKNKTLGLIAALLLATNHIFWFYSVRPMADAPLTTVMILLLYSITKLEKTIIKKEQIKWAIIATITAASTVFFKVQAVIILLAYILYFIIFKRKEAFTQKKYQIAWIPIVILLTIAQLAATFIFKTGALDRVFLLFLHLRGIPYGFEALNQLIWSYTWYLIPFAIISIPLLIFYKEKKFIFPAWIFTLYFLFFEMNVDQTADRYLLPLLPIAIIFAAYTIEEVSNIFSKLTIKKLKIPAIILITILISLHFHSLGDPLIEARAYSYLGHPEAGEFLKQNMQENDILFAASPRMMRAFTRLEYYNQGPEDSRVTDGPLYWLRGERYHENFDDYDFCNEVKNPNAHQNFIDDMNNFTQNQTIWLELDVWEYTQPRWYFDYCGGTGLNQNSLAYFESMGFQLQHVVVRDLDPGEGIQESGVIFIFKLEQNSFIDPTTQVASDTN